MNEGFKKRTKVLNDILRQQRLPCEKSGICFCTSQEAKSKTLKFSQEEAEEKAKNLDHGDETWI